MLPSSRTIVSPGGQWCSGVDVGRGISLGIRADYTAANYAKYKDLRHKNKLMDLTVSAGLMIPVCSVLSLGADYRYHRNIESVSFATYGKSDKVYKSLTGYGNFIGKVEQFGNSYGYNGQLTYRRRHTLHQLAVRLEAEKLQNNAETCRELQNEAGSYYYEYYHDVKTADKLWVNTAVDYTLHLGIRHELPAWTLHAAFAMLHRKQTAYLYPYLRRQKIDNNSATVQATRNLCLQHGVLSVSAVLGYQKGSGEPYEDATFTQPSDKQTSPDAMNAWLWREYQYLTAAQYTIGGSMKYAFIFPGTRLMTHAGLTVSHRKANETYEYSNGKDYTQMAVSIGCTF